MPEALAAFLHERNVDTAHRYTTDQGYEAAHDVPQQVAEVRRQALVPALELKEPGSNLPLDGSRDIFRAGHLDDVHLSVIESPASGWKPSTRPFS